MTLRSINYWLGFLGLCLVVQVEYGTASAPTPGSTRLWVETRAAFLRRCLKQAEKEQAAQARDQHATPHA